MSADPGNDISLTSVPVTFPVISDLIKGYIAHRNSFRDLEQIVPLSIKRFHFEMDDIDSIVVVTEEAPLETEEAGGAANTRQLMKFAAHEADELRKLVQHIEDGKDDTDEIEALKKLFQLVRNEYTKQGCTYNADWMMELVTL
ncbi:uncharacterized protein FTJAE_13632 [Fusarium tjaetaba]|uniref:Uncharacterized protein n=1 Tax=Fusarium tjaetaba TaxID=1567544 RepID=A0A8H5QF13_9HYPO|nr:uncharacterized protein FTJAE_13632 [Fusarium tjaetaba]KAF5614681.1 hypothetical protein FTJAE_13632 [Fusarium tjaetaba]